MENRTSAFFGGSFDPPHMCHVLVAALGLSSGEVDDLLVVPCFAHPFDKKMVGFEHRMEMARLAFAPFGDRVTVSDIERRLGGKSRTLTTIQALQNEMPQRRLRLLIGSDIMQERDSWHRFDEVEKLAPPLVVGRQGHDPGTGIVLPGISSSQVRLLLAQGADIAGLVPEPVVRYIRRCRLYPEGATS